MRIYDKYKDSGVEWIGEIPEHWEVKKLKYVISIRSGESIEPIFVNDEFSIPIYGGNGIMGYTTKSNSTDKELIIGRVGAYCGNVYLSQEEKWISDNALRVLTNQIWGFIFHFLKALNLNKYASQNAQPLITGTLVKDQIISLPPIFEQISIANYIDSKTTEIDQTIADKAALIILFEEEKKALINEVVTKGLNPNVKLKPSGVDWLGKIPEHWEVKKLKYLGIIKYGLGQPPKEKEDGLPLIRATNVERGSINEKNLIFVDPDDVPYERDPVLKENDIIVVRSGAYTADSAIIPKKFEGAITGYDMVFRSVRVIPHFIAYCFLSNYVLNIQLIPVTIRAAQPHLNREELGDTFIFFPPVGEQSAIVQYLNAAILDINEKVDLIKKEIELLKEYRQVLIFEAVTGKIKVD